MTHYHRLHNEEHLMIRPIAPEDDPQLEELQVLLAKQAETVVSNALDPIKQSMSSTALYDIYQVSPGQKPDRAYWVLVDEQDNRVMGGVGFAARNEGEGQQVCELQHLYLHPQLHGKGAGRKLVEYCMREAAKLGYRQMYLESAASPQQDKNSGMRFFRTGRTVKITGITPS